MNVNEWKIIKLKRWMWMNEIDIDERDWLMKDMNVDKGNECKWKNNYTENWEMKLWMRIFVIFKFKLLD